MSASEADRVRELVALCLDRLERNDADAAEAVCREHPQHAAAIRQRLDLLERSGLLVRPEVSESSAVPDAMPEKLGDFRLLRKLGEGGMGVVYLALQESLQREVALKLVRPDQLWFAGARERFRREVDAIARLQHPGVVPIHAVGEEAGIPYFAMEKVSGATLADVLAALAGADASGLAGRDMARAIAARAEPADGPAGDASAAFVFDGTWAETCFRIVLQVAEALEHVHRRGVLHRDLKPSNVMVTRAGRAMVLDFGLASTTGASRLTRSGARLGSLPYLAPEQWSGNGDRIDARTDLYALGVTLYEMLTMRAPYADSSAEGLMRTIEIGRPDSVRALNRSVSWDAETVCLTAMEREPSRRYASAADFARDLANVLHHRPIEARRPGVALRARRWGQRHPALRVGIALGSLLLIGAPTTFGWMERAARLRVDKAYRRADGLRLSGQSTALLATDPGLALLIAIEGAERQPGCVANDALYAALAACHEEHTLVGHGGAVEQAAFSPDGTCVATCSRDGTGIVWDAQRGMERRILFGHGDAVRSITFSPDGNRLVTASADGQARVWDVAAGTCLCVLRGHRGALHGAAFDSGGQRILTWSADATARIWDAVDGRLLHTLTGAGGEVTDARFSRDGRSIVAASEDGSARIFDADSGECVQRFELGDPVWCARFSPTGDRVALCGRARAARVFEVASGRELVPPLQHLDAVATIDWSPDGTRLLTSSWDHTLGLWNAVSGERLFTWHGQRRIVRFARFSPDGSLVLSGGDDATAHLWSTINGKEFDVLRGHAGPIVSGDFSSDGRRVVTAGDTARIWSVPRAALQVEWEGHRDKVQNISVSKDGTRFVTASRDGTAKIWDTQTRRLELTLAGHDGRVHSAAFSPDGACAVTGSDDQTARVWDAVTGVTLSVLEGHRELLTWAVFDATGARVLTLSQDETARVWDWKSGRVLLTLAGHHGTMLRGEFSADGARVATVTADGTTTVWDATTGVELMKLDLGSSDARAVRFSPDGRRVVILLAGKPTASICDLATNQIVQQLRGRGGTVHSATFSPDGSRVATSNDDAEVRLWEAATGELLATLAGHEEIVPYSGFLPDGTTLVTASIDGDVRTWPIDPLAAALAAKPRELTADEHIAFEVGDPSAWREAKEIVRALEEKCALAEEVVAGVRIADLGEGVRDSALTIARELRDHPIELARASWAIACTPGRSEADYRLALRRAEQSCRMVPGVGDFERAVGVAQFRLGLDELCVTTLARPEVLVPDGDGGRGGGNDYFQTLAFLAMAQERLGHREEARAALATLRARAADPARVPKALLALLHEVEAMVEGGSARADPPSTRDRDLDAPSSH